jgi:cytochrome P450
MNESSAFLPAQRLHRTRLDLPPGPRGLPLIGSFVDAHRDILGLLERSVRDFGPTVRIRFGPFDVALIQRPEDIRHVLVQNHENYQKSPTYAVLRMVLGNGLLTSEGAFWRRQRKLAQPAFHHQRLVGFADTMARLADDCAHTWERADEVDVHQEMMRLTLRIVGHTLLSTELADDAGRLGAALGEVLAYAQNFEALLFLPSWVPTVGRRRARRAIAELDAIVLRLIADRRSRGEPGDDLLGMLLEATDDAGRPGMTDQQLRDELMTLILAGHETTANALSWTFYLLSRHPEVEARLVRELREVIGTGPARFGDLDRLVYTECVIREAMRLYPPAWMIERQAIARDRVGGYDLPAGWLVAVAPWTLHRDPDLYPEPEAFRPERFAPEAAASRSRYAYLPFGAGPRTCIGNAFAVMEAKLVLATLASRFRLTRVSSAPVEPDPGVTLRPRGDLRMRVTARAAAPATGRDGDASAPPAGLC